MDEAAQPISSWPPADADDTEQLPEAALPESVLDIPTPDEKTEEPADRTDGAGSVTPVRDELVSIPLPQAPALSPSAPAGDCIEISEDGLEIVEDFTKKSVRKPAMQLRERHMSNESLSSVSIGSLPLAVSGDEAAARPENISSEEFSSFSDFCADENTKPRSDIEEGEIFPPSTSGSRPRSREYSRSPVRAKSPPSSGRKTKQRQSSPKAKRKRYRSSGSSKQERRRDLPRYDVRNLIRERKSKKKRNRNRSASSDISFRSLSPEPFSPKQRRRSHFRSPSYDRSLSRSYSPPPRRRSIPRRSPSYSPVRHKSPKTTKRRARSRSSESPPKKKGKKKGKMVTKRKVSRTKRVSRSRSKSPVRRKVKETSPKRKSELKHSKKKDKLRKEKKGKKNTKKKKHLNHNDKSPPLRTSNFVSEKEVFASGDKIMVSVNFKSKDKTSPTKKKSLLLSDVSKTATNDNGMPPPAPAKAVVIDVMSSPYRVIEPSPQETIDLYSDTEEKQFEKFVVADEHKGPCTPPVEENIDLAKGPQTPHRGPQTPPTVNDETIDVPRGPQTPNSDPIESYDPCNPTDSPEVAESNDFTWQDLARSQAWSDLLKDGAKEVIPSRTEPREPVSNIPFISERAETAAEQTNGNGDKNDYPVDMDMDSPFSPQSSDMSDIFEPPMPLNTPLTNRKMKKLPRSKGKKASKLKKDVQMKVIDDKLKIIDEVPTSAVEMQVKEKIPNLACGGRDKEENAYETSPKINFQKVQEFEETKFDSENEFGEPKLDSDTDLTEEERLEKALRNQISTSRVIESPKILDPFFEDSLSVEYRAVTPDLGVASPKGDDEHRTPPFESGIFDDAEAEANDDTEFDSVGFDGSGNDSPETSRFEESQSGAPRLFFQRFERSEANSSDTDEENKIDSRRGSRSPPSDHLVVKNPKFKPAEDNDDSTPSSGSGHIILKNPNFDALNSSRSDHLIVRNPKFNSVENRANSPMSDISDNNIFEKASESPAFNSKESDHENDHAELEENRADSPMSTKSGHEAPIVKQTEIKEDKADSPMTIRSAHQTFEKAVAETCEPPTSNPPKRDKNKSDSPMTTGTKSVHQTFEKTADKSLKTPILDKTVSDQTKFDENVIDLTYCEDEDEESKNDQKKKTKRARDGLSKRKRGLFSFDRFNEVRIDLTSPERLENGKESLPERGSVDFDQEKAKANIESPKINFDFTSLKEYRYDLNIHEQLEKDQSTERNDLDLCGFHERRIDMTNQEGLEKGRGKTLEERRLNIEKDFEKAKSDSLNFEKDFEKSKSGSPESATFHLDRSDLANLEILDKDKDSPEYERRNFDLQMEFEKSKTNVPEEGAYHLARFDWTNNDSPDTRVNNVTPDRSKAYSPDIGDFDLQKHFEKSNSNSPERGAFHLARFDLTNNDAPDRSKVSSIEIRHVDLHKNFEKSKTNTSENGAFHLARFDWTNNDEPDRRTNHVTPDISKVYSPGIGNDSHRDFEKSKSKSPERGAFNLARFDLSDNCTSLEKRLEEIGSFYLNTDFEKSKSDSPERRNFQIGSFDQHRFDSTGHERTERTKVYSPSQAERFDLSKDFEKAMSDTPERDTFHLGRFDEHRFSLTNQESSGRNKAHSPQIGRFDLNKDFESKSNSPDMGASHLARFNLSDFDKSDGDQPYSPTTGTFDLNKAFETSKSNSPLGFDFTRYNENRFGLAEKSNGIRRNGNYLAEGPEKSNSPVGWMEEQSRLFQNQDRTSVAKSKSVFPFNVPDDSHKDFAAEEKEIQKRIERSKSYIASKVQPNADDNGKKIEPFEETLRKAIQESFLKKVQRQERIVEEIKNVLKPYYNRRKLTKDSYKEILRKCVPKVCHSKNGEINPSKIEKLVKGYVKKYSYLQKRSQKTRMVPPLL